MRKKVFCLIATVCFLGVFAPCGIACAQPSRIEVPDIGFSVAFPDNFYAAAKDNTTDATVPPGLVDTIADLRSNNQASFLWAVNTDKTLYLTAAEVQTVIKDYRAGNEAQIKKDMEMSKTAIPTTSALLKIEMYQTEASIYIKRIIRYQGEYWIKYETVENGYDYFLNFQTKGYGGRDKQLTSQDEASTDAVVDSIVLKHPQDTVTPSPSQAKAQAQATALLPAASANSTATPVPNTTVEISGMQLNSFNFLVPASFTGITRSDDILSTGRWKDLFAEMQPKMEAAGVYYYALRTDNKYAVPSQMAVCASGADPNALQTFFDEGLQKLYAITGAKPRTIQDPGEQNTKYYDNNVTFNKNYRFTGQYSWVLYTPERSDVPFAFAYAPGNQYVTALESSDLEKMIKSFHAQLKSGENIPGNISASDYVMMPYYILIGSITGGCILTAILLVVLRYRADKKAIRQGAQYSQKALLKRLRVLLDENILTNEEYNAKREEIKNRYPYA